MTPEPTKPELQELIDISNAIYQPIIDILKVVEDVHRQTAALQAEIHSLNAEIELLRGPPTQEVIP